MACALENLSCYDFLGLLRTATAADVRHAYRQRALETHPDKGGNAENFRRVVIAFETLVNERSRREYDVLLSRSKSADGCGTVASNSTTRAGVGDGIDLATGGHTNVIPMQMHHAAQANSSAAKAASASFVEVGVDCGKSTSSASTDCNLVGGRYMPRCSSPPRRKARGAEHFDAVQLLEVLLRQEQEWDEMLHGNSDAQLRALFTAASDLLERKQTAVHRRKRRRRDKTTQLELHKCNASSESDRANSLHSSSSNMELRESSSCVAITQQESEVHHTNDELILERIDETCACLDDIEEPACAPTSTTSRDPRVSAGNRALIRGIISSSYKAVTSYVAMVGFRHLIIYSQRTRLLDTAIAFHITLTEIKGRVEREQEDTSSAPSLETSVREAIHWACEEKCSLDAQTQHPPLCLRFKVGFSISGKYLHTGITRNLDVALCQRQSLFESRQQGPQKTKEVYSSLMVAHKELQRQSRENARSERAAMIRQETAQRQEERLAARAAARAKIQEEKVCRNKLRLLVRKLGRMLAPRQNKPSSQTKSGLQRLLHKEGLVNLPPDVGFVEKEADGGPGFHTICHGLMGPVRCTVLEAQRDADCLMDAFRSGGFETMRHRLCALEIEHFSQTQTVPWM